MTASNPQTIVQTVLRLGSKRTTFPSMDLELVLYMGFSNVAWPLLFSCTEQPVNSALSDFLPSNEKEKTIRHHNSLLFLIINFTGEIAPTSVYTDKTQSLQKSGQRKAQESQRPQSCCWFWGESPGSWWTPLCSDLNEAWWEMIMFNSATLI